MYQCFPPTIKDDRIFVNPPEEVEILGSQDWKGCFSGYFLDKRSPYKEKTLLLASKEN